METERPLPLTTTGNTTNANEIPNGFAPGDARESAILATLTPGNYTAVVRGSGNTTGIALVEAYHLH
jgi:hypothetical protein